MACSRPSTGTVVGPFSHELAPGVIAVASWTRSVGGSRTLDKGSSEVVRAPKRTRVSWADA
jgi:hypothetical protein